MWTEDNGPIDSHRWFIVQGFPPAEAEFRFHPKRRWRFDFAWPELRIAFEIEGGKWTRGRHQRPKGFEEDCIKYSWAAILGWRVVRATKDMIRRGEAVALLHEAHDRVRQEAIWWQKRVAATSTSGPGT